MAVLLYEGGLFSRGHRGALELRVDVGTALTTRVGSTAPRMSVALEERRVLRLRFLDEVGEGSETVSTAAGERRGLVCRQDLDRDLVTIDRILDPIREKGGKRVETLGGSFGLRQFGDEIVRSVGILVLIFPKVNLAGKRVLFLLPASLVLPEQCLEVALVLELLLVGFGSLS